MTLPKSSFELSSGSSSDWCVVAGCRLPVAGDGGDDRRDPHEDPVDDAGELRVEVNGQDRQDEQDDRDGREADNVEFFTTATLGTLPRFSQDRTRDILARFVPQSWRTRWIRGFVENPAPNVEPGPDSL